MAERGERERTRARKVQEAAANMQQLAARANASPAARPRRSRAATSRRSTRATSTPPSRCGREGGRENVRGQVDVLAPEGVRDVHRRAARGACPDLQHAGRLDDHRGRSLRRPVAPDTAPSRGPGSFGGIAPHGHAVELEGFDLLTVRDGLIQSNDAFTDSMTFARQIGMMPPQDSARRTAHDSARSTPRRGSPSRLAGGEPELVAEGVWVVQGQPGRCNVYLIEDDGGVTLFDAGARTMTRAVATRRGAKLGGIRRVVLGHGHTDHRGTAPALGVPVLCHPDEVQDAEGSGGFRYWPRGPRRACPRRMRQLHRLLHRYAWDGGPVKIAGTVKEGDEVAGFKVIELPGHAPGQIGLWRESDRLALTQRLLLHDRHVGPRLRRRTCPRPSTTTTPSRRARACASWPRSSPRPPGRATPSALTGDVRGQLERGRRGAG